MSTYRPWNPPTAAELHRMIQLGKRLQQRWSDVNWVGGSLVVHHDGDAQVVVGVRGDLLLEFCRESESDGSLSWHTEWLLKPCGSNYEMMKRAVEMTYADTGHFEFALSVLRASQPWYRYYPMVAVGTVKRHWLAHRLGRTIKRLQRPAAIA